MVAYRSSASPSVEDVIVWPEASANENTPSPAHTGKEMDAHLGCSDGWM